MLPMRDQEHFFVSERDIGDFALILPLLVWDKSQVSGFCTMFNFLFVSRETAVKRQVLSA